MLRTKIDYKRTVKEVSKIVKFVYPDRKETERQSYQRHATPIIHNNVSLYTQALMKFHGKKSSPTKLSNKRLNIQFKKKLQQRKEIHEKR